MTTYYFLSTVCPCITKDNKILHILHNKNCFNIILHIQLIKFFLPALGLRFCTLKKDFAEANGLPAAPPPRVAPAAVEEPVEEEEVEEEVAAPAEVAAADGDSEKVELVFPAEEEGMY
jgi:hypothetical protein